jgi:hypothetical protein
MRFLFGQLGLIIVSVCTGSSQVLYSQLFWNVKRVRQQIGFHLEKKKTVFWIFLSGSDLADHEIVSGSILAITHTDITHETVQVILKNIKDMLYCLSKFSNFL